MDIDYLGEVETINRSSVSSGTVCVYKVNIQDSDPNAVEITVSEKNSKLI